MTDWLRSAKVSAWTAKFLLWMSAEPPKLLVLCHVQKGSQCRTHWRHVKNEAHHSIDLAVRHAERDV